MSGTSNTPRRLRITSASGVVGPFAPSTMIRAWISAALSALIWASMAAGNRTSTGNRSKSSTRTTQRNRLASHDAWLDVAFLHREGVHHPGHNFGTGANVWRWNVHRWPDEIEDLGDVAASDSLELAIQLFA